MSLNRILAVVVRHLYNFRHNLDRLSDSFYWPAMDIVLWGLTSKYIQGSDSGISNLIMIFLSGLIFWQVVWRGQYEITTNFLEEIWNQNLVNLFASPLKVSEWISGVILLGVVKLIGTIVFAIALTQILYAVNLFEFGMLLIPFFALLLMVGWWVGLLVAGLIVRFGREIQTLAWTGVFLLAPFSAIYYPVSSLPGWAQLISKALPPSYIFEGMRQVLTTGQIPVNHLLIAFGLNLIFLILAIRFFHFAFKKSRELGLARLDN